MAFQKTRKLFTQMTSASIGALARRRLSRRWVSMNPPEIERHNGKRNCAGYAVDAAKKIFGLNYKRGDAWDLPAKNKIVWDKLANNGATYSAKLKPGMIVAIFLPESELQKNGPIRRFTHVSLFIGKRYGKNTVFQNYGGEHHSVVLEEFLEATRGKVVQLLWPNS